MTIQHFIDIADFDQATLRSILDLATALRGRHVPLLAGKELAMIFEKPSTRTRVSFEVAMRQLGGNGVVMAPKDTQLGRGETIADTARVLSRYVDAIMIRTDDPAKLDQLVHFGSVPVINGLTDASHPCQIMADIMTFEQHRGPIKGRVVVYLGDGNNVATSWIQAAARFGFEMRLACPKSLEPAPAAVAWARKVGGKIVVSDDAESLLVGADCVVTDTWVSMGAANADIRHRLLDPYRVDDELMAIAKPDALFMHCLPAHRGEEVTDSVIDGPQSVVWDEAENRLHVQKGILAWCFGVTPENLADRIAR